MLEAYYRSLIKQKGGCGYIAITDGQIAGFVCGVWDPSLVKTTLIKDQWKNLLVASLQVLLHSPKLIINILSRLSIFRKTEKDALLRGYELRPIVVEEKLRGTQVASLLVSALATDASKRGYSSIYLLTEQDNIAANKFYQKQGFESQGIIVRSKIVYEYYTRGL
jgi:ribosomal protein S18 acetylase RimI-like enzyme